MLVAALLLGGVAFLLLGGWPVADGENRSELLSTDWNLEWMQMQADRRRADDPGGAGDPVRRMNRIVCKIKRAQASGIGACALFWYGWD